MLSDKGYCVIYVLFCRLWLWRFRVWNRWLQTALFTVQWRWKEGRNYRLIRQRLPSQRKGPNKTYVDNLVIYAVRWWLLNNKTSTGMVKQKKGYSSKYQDVNKYLLLRKYLWTKLSRLSEHPKMWRHFRILFRSRLSRVSLLLLHSLNKYNVLPHSKTGYLLYGIQNATAYIIDFSSCFN